jgi:hypothetical protein
MRTRARIAVAVAVLVLASSMAFAQKKKEGKADVLGVYDVRYEEVSSNCEQTSIAMSRGTIDITKKKGQIVVDILRFPLMYGAPGKGGKVRAASKLDKSSIEGVDGKFSVAGRVDEGLISLVFVAEYYVNGKPLCSQTWNVSGQRSTSAEKSQKPRKKAPKRQSSSRL